MNELYVDYFKNKAHFHADGLKFIFGFAVLTLVSFWFSDLLFLLNLFFTLVCIFFFRMPHRYVIIDDNVIISPCSGTVADVSVVDLPSECGIKEKRWKISVFLSVFDAHVNRMPVNGTVKLVHYTPGRFFRASLEKSTDYNERNIIGIDFLDGKKDIFVTQVAGLLCRRIVCDVNVGDHVNIGNCYGIIRFGSRVDIYLPKDIKPLVSKGVTCIDGETILADINYNNERTINQVK